MPGTSSQKTAGRWIERPLATIALLVRLAAALLQAGVILGVARFIFL